MSRSNYTAQHIVRFEDRLADLMVADLDFERRTAVAYARGVGQAIVLGSEDESAYAVSQGILDAAGIRQAWNHVFGRYRADFMARWVLPHLQGTTLDLLCGDGKVTEKLANFGNSVSGAERASVTYEDCSALEHLRFVPFEELSLDPNPARYDTVLLITVLHHEISPQLTWELARRIARRRIVVIENCVTPNCPDSYQELVDIFFNKCLNETNAPAPNEHRSDDGWVEFFGRDCSISAIEHADNVPGIPLQHSLFVVDIDDVT